MQKKKDPLSSASISPKYGDTETVTYGLVSDNAAGAKWQVSGRSLGLPKTLELNRKVGAPGAMGNDHVILRFSQTEANTETGKIATGSVTLDVSIPRDVATITQAMMNDLLGMLSSLLNDLGAVEDTASRANCIALLEGVNL
jgi:hypothetical protein